jgi:molybdopterin molybdotransferase
MKLTVISERRRQAFRDVRERGFADRTSIDEVFAWIDRYARITEPERIAIEESVGRFLAEPFIAPSNVPRIDRAESDGFAVRSCETIGAASYNPIPFSLQSPRNALRPFSAALVMAGVPLPLGADAVVPFDLSHAEEKFIQVILPVAQGDGVNRTGQNVRQEDVLIPSSRPLRTSDIGLISGFGINEISVLRRPRVRIIVAGSKSSVDRRAVDVNGPMLVPKILRDGATIEGFRFGIESVDALAEWVSRPGADVVIICGRTGTGPDDDAPLALATAGEVSIHGIAVHPGSSTGMGFVGEVPVLLLPGSPLECLCAYDLFAGRLIRNLSGRGPALPYRAIHAKAGRKFISSAGTTELCPVRLKGEEAIPLGSVSGGDFASIARADGFVLIPETMEGYPPGTPITVYHYDGFNEAGGLL